MTCVSLVLRAIISFRSVPRVLRILAPVGSWVPHFTSVINWTLRLGLFRLQSVRPVKDPWVAIVDASIDIGMKKVLVILRVKLDALKTLGAGISLKDCECVGVKVSGRWNGELVAEAISDIFDQCGTPAAVIKDDGGDLKKGLTIYCEKNRTKIFDIGDIGHYTANSLKGEFNKYPKFIVFLNLVTHISTQLKHTALSYLMAPNLGNHSRFLRISKTAAWATKVIELLANKKIPLDGVSKNLKGTLSKLLKMKVFIKRFGITCQICEQILKLLKLNGLSEKTYSEATKIINSLPSRSLVRKRTLVWLEKHILIYRALNMGEMSLPVSSDIIESLFGKFKTIMQRCPRAEFNRMVLLMPCLCGNNGPTSIAEALSSTSHLELKNWEKMNVTETIRQIKRRGLRGTKTRE